MSNHFSVSDGLRQGGILLLIFFGVYMDYLSKITNKQLDDLLFFVPSSMGLSIYMFRIWDRT